MNPSFIYFDLDNTLLDHSSAEKKAQREIYRSNPELQKVSLQDWLESYRGVNSRLWLQYQNGEIDRHQLQHSRFFDSMQQIDLPTGRSGEIGTQYMSAYRKYWSWIDGAREAFLTLSEQYPVGIITNGFTETQQLKFEKLGLESYCEVMIITEEIGKLKPHPKVFDTGTERAGVEREKILYVGDSYSSDITGGKNAGWKTAWYTAFTEKVAEGQSADILFDKYPNLVKSLTKENYVFK